MRVTQQVSEPYRRRANHPFDWRHDYTKNIIIKWKILQCLTYGYKNKCKVGEMK